MIPHAAEQACSALEQSSGLRKQAKHHRRRRMRETEKGRPEVITKARNPSSSPPVPHSIPAKLFQLECEIEAIQAQVEKRMFIFQLPALPPRSSACSALCLVRNDPKKSKEFDKTEGFRMLEGTTASAPSRKGPPPPLLFSKRCRDDSSVNILSWVRWQVIVLGSTHAFLLCVPLMRQKQQEDSCLQSL